MIRLTSFLAGLVALPVIGAGLAYVEPMVFPTAASAQPCHEGPRLYVTDHAAYERQARRVFATWGVPFADHRQYELDHRVPRCLGGSDTDDNLWPQPIAEARIKDTLEAEACRRVCQAHTMMIGDAMRLFDDWKAGYQQIFGRAP
jgi:hypothetical protein